MCIRDSSILSDDPCWRAASAPMLRWSKEIWITRTRLFDGSLSFEDLRSAWNAVFSLDRVTWPTAKGPLSAPRLSLLRHGWRMTNFMTVVDDRGYQSSL
eukprot:3442812-Pyramimonas_sp.AAC.1